MNRFVVGIVLVFLAVLFQQCSQGFSTHAEAPAEAKPFSFAAYGDMPYRDQDFDGLYHLIDAINADQRIAFTIHVGDLKSGSQLCSDEYLLKVREAFDAFERPMFYTPGDNEWTDCNRKKCGEYDPLERLAWLRKTFYGEKQVYGKTTLAATSQPDVHKAHSATVENQLWEYGGVVFGSMHVVGTNNGRVKDVAGMEEEWAQRDAANINWLEHIFETAMKSNAHGVVLTFHANPFAYAYPVAASLQNVSDAPEESGFKAWLTRLVDLSIAYNKPIMLIHGDFHYFIYDKPLMNPANRCMITHVDRVQVFGAADMHAVKIEVHPGEQPLFRVVPLMVPENDLRTAGTERCKY